MEPEVKNTRVRIEKEIATFDSKAHKRRLPIQVRKGYNVKYFPTQQAHPSVSGIGVARWPDIPPHGGVAQGFLLIPVSGVDDAEGRVREQIGEEKIGGNGRNGTSKRET